MKLETGSGCMKFMHIADVHLGAVPDTGCPWAEQRSKEIWEAFYEVLDTAKAENVDFVFIAGDLFHRAPLLRELKELNYRFAGIKPVRIVIMAGNHDYLRHDSRYLSFEWSENVSFFKSQKMECLHFTQEKTYVYGLSYENFEIETPLYDHIRPFQEEGCHILLAHGGDSTHVPINMKKLSESGFDYVAMGHIHKPAIMYDGKMAYSGALVPIDRNDTGEHGYIMGTWDGTAVQTQFVPVQGRRYIHFTVVMDGRMPWGMAVDFAAEEIAKYGNQHIYKIILSGFRDPDMEMDLEQMYRLGNVAEIEDRTEPDYDFDALYAANRDNVIGMYIQKVRALPAEQESKNKALYYGLKALLR